MQEKVVHLDGCVAAAIRSAAMVYLRPSSQSLREAHERLDGVAVREDE